MIMMMKRKPMIFIVFMFVLSSLYLHQKVQIYVQAYQLSRNYQVYNELLDKNDYLMYNFAKLISLAKVNQWAENNNFHFVGREKMLALNLGDDKLSGHKSSKFAFLYNRFLKIPTGSSTALAEERE
jgi:hypothetical protein